MVVQQCCQRHQNQVEESPRWGLIVDTGLLGTMPCAIRDKHTHGCPRLNQVNKRPRKHNLMQRGCYLVFQGFPLAENYQTKFHRSNFFRKDLVLLTRNQQKGPCLLLFLTTLHNHLNKKGSIWPGGLIFPSAKSKSSGHSTWQPTESLLKP